MDLHINNSSILMIILGLLAIIFPVISTTAIGVFVSFGFVIIAVLLFVFAISHFPVSKLSSIIYIILAILCLIFAWMLAFNPFVIAGLTSILIYALGIMLVISGLFGVLLSSINRTFTIIGAITIVFGLIYIISALLVDDPVILGTVIGLWLIISGITSILSDD